MRSITRTGQALAILFFAVALCQCASNEPISKPRGASNTLALITAHDPVGSFVGLESTLSKNLQALARPVDLTHRRIGSINELRSSIATTSAQHGLIDTLILACHGTSGSLRVGHTENINQRNLTIALDQVSTHLADEANIILYACLTGEGSDNFAIDLARALKRPVVAPRYFWLMQRAVPLQDRAAELTLDDRGQLTIHDDVFAHYYKARLDSGRDRHLIAPKSMDSLCRADGFEPRASRFRALFETFQPTN